MLASVRYECLLAHHEYHNHNSLPDKQSARRRLPCRTELSDYVSAVELKFKNISVAENVAEGTVRSAFGSIFCPTIKGTPQLYHNDR